MRIEMAHFPNDSLTNGPSRRNRLNSPVKLIAIVALVCWIQGNPRRTEFLWEVVSDPMRAQLAYLTAGIPLLCMLSFTLYRLDKSRAKQELWRIPEATLHQFDILGGWPGGLAAQLIFRHKLRKPSFVVRYWLTVVVHIVGCTNLVFWNSPLAQSFSREEMGFALLIQIVVVLIAATMVLALSKLRCFLARLRPRRPATPKTQRRL